MAWFAIMSDKTIVRLTKKNGGVYEPEMRLIDCIWFSFVLPITFFWYGWSTYYRVHWIVPIIGLFPFGLAIMCIWQVRRVRPDIYLLSLPPFMQMLTAW